MISLLPELLDIVKNFAKETFTILDITFYKNNYIIIYQYFSKKQ